VVVIVPTTLRPIRSPDCISSRREIPGCFNLTSSMPAATSIARSITAPEEERKIAPM
jgi:hypothetical protein